MNSVHRQFGKFMKRSADDSQVSVLLKDFDDADKLLARVIDSSKAWRDAWMAILTYQSRMVQEFESLYNPIVGSSEPSARPPAETPEATLARTARLQEVYEELKTELLTEINGVDERMIKPAMDAKDYLQPFKKIIKKRDDKKLDFERYQNRVDTSRKKTKRSDRDNAALAKAEIDLSRAKDEYSAADDHLRAHLPPLITATFSILPHLLAAQIDIQNTLLALYYTTLHNYCEQENFPSPPPAMDLVIQTWERDISPALREVETITCLSHRRPSRQPRTSDEHRNGSFANGLNARRTNSNQPAIRKPSVSPIRIRAPSPVLESKPRLNGNANGHSPNTTYSSSTKSKYSPEIQDYSTIPAPSIPPTGYSPAGPRVDYFSRERQPSSSGHSSAGAVSSLGMTQIAAAAAKKKPPPPPPRSASSPAVFVTALYDFPGQGSGDLAFREGDRIRVLKRTDSTDDWWEGELKGVKGSFPANYCE
ncbi:SH3 domain signaling protein [Histoplasma capsulatum var. duboisii H88]|uniref:SH3 domain signaling protein n=1 Tax=Ajellomyces capsulatus (strain H88) TaxID=544711 RepID=F0UEZ2_AJEC8|nr:SH3 domain signaling protein [Histoplasma capsulatum var. duboisii H88]QSS55625.1 SH3 domain signaling protein [Histoplasma capsulatum var. duboisii H88]